ncbi:cytochrome c1 [Gluconobacter morbifer]|uniref:Cytochrome c1 n=1 Tax=Gluconobacter morbifer G707 TaxID=1088869 RepID=G6XFA4_9PROT|nr:cytochrome c1 [Gluconobacter morbifer]EHH68862.1 ubiquinol-cytochrome-c reductase [Gluconobacter morbifer G707]
MTRFPFSLLLLLLLSGFSSATAAPRNTPEQRGLMVYQQVCSACHGMASVTYEDMTAFDLPPTDIKGWAGQHQMPDGLDDDGDPKTRPARPADHILSPYPSEAMARMANHGIIPPDFSRLALTLPGGAAQIRRILTSYSEPPSGVHLQPGRYYNTALRWKHIDMPPPLHDGMLTYPDGTSATAKQMAADVATFLDSVAHPHWKERRKTGWLVLAYLALMAVLTFLLKRRIWRSLP